MNQTAATPVDPVIRLPASLTIDSVERFVTDLLEMPLEYSGAIAVDASALEVLTTPGVQVILALHGATQVANGTLQIHGASPAIQGVFRQLGLSALLETLLSSQSLPEPEPLHE